MEIYEVFRSDRNINRAVPVLFAKRNIKIGEELTFNYKMVKEEKIDSESECDENPEESEIEARARLFKCLCGAKSCKDKVWTEAELAEKLAKEKLKKKKSQAKSQKRKVSSDSIRKKPKAKKKRLNL